jgi:Bacterial Ig-like domain (group 3)/FG-GAP-like repeat
MRARSAAYTLTVAVEVREVILAILRRVLVSAVLIVLLAPLTALARTIHFAAAKTKATGIDHTYRVAVGDFNRDGIPDLAISSNYNQVAIFLGHGDGTFTGPTIYNLTFYVTGSVVVGDFTGDGKLDLAIVGGDTSGNGLALLTGNGDGSFNPPIYFQTTLAGASITAVADDLTHTHSLDLYVGGNGTSGVILGDGKGDFQNGQLEEGVFGFGVAAGDFDRDGNLDVASTQAYQVFTPPSVSILLGNGDGTFQSPQTYPGMEEPFGIAAGDFNGDKKLDLAVADYLFNTVVILQGNGDGTFTNIGQWFAGINPSIVAVSDFNMDGKADLAVSAFGGNAVTVLTGKGDGTFPSLMSLPTGTGPANVVAVDLNHDGSPDLVSVNNGDETFSVLLNAAGTYVQLSSSPNPSASGQAVSFTAKVRGSVTTSVVPSGSVVFKDGAKTLGSVRLSGGIASFTISTLSQGAHGIVATYSGDTNFNPNQSKSLLQTVNK